MGMVFLFLPSSMASLPQANQTPLKEGATQTAASPPCRIPPGSKASRLLPPRRFGDEIKQSLAIFLICRRTCSSSPVASTFQSPPARSRGEVSRPFFMWNCGLVGVLFEEEGVSLRYATCYVTVLPTPNTPLVLEVSLETG